MLGLLHVNVLSVRDTMTEFNVTRLSYLLHKDTVGSRNIQWVIANANLLSLMAKV